MSFVMVNRQKLINIAGSVREKCGLTEKLTLDQICERVRNISSVGEEAKKLVEVNIEMICCMSVSITDREYSV